MPSPATLKVPGTSPSDGVPEHVEQVVLVQELQARVEAEHRRDHRQPEVRRDRADDAAGRSRWRARSMVTRDVGAAAGEPADVALDLGDVLGVARARAAARGSMSSVNIAGSRLLAP